MKNQYLSGWEAKEREIDEIMGVAVKKPRRIQRKREIDFDLRLASRSVNGLDCVYVGRPTKFGNPFKAQVMGAGPAVSQFREWLKSHAMFMTPESANQRDELISALPTLRGKNLACWCALDKPCHADVLLEMANE